MMQNVHSCLAEVNTSDQGEGASAKIPGFRFGCSVSAQMDRALKKFLSFPVFDPKFVDAICDVGLGRSEFWMVLDFDEDAGSQAFDLIPALGGSAESKNFLASRHDLFMILAEMVQKGRQTVFESLFTDLGFGAGSQEQVSKNKPAGSVLRSGTDQGPIKRPNPHSSAAVCVSLKAQEETEKSKWSTRLQRIATRAGAAAKINGPAREGLSAREDEAIKSIVFKSGAFRTMRQNIRAWEKFDEWANEAEVNIYPPTDAVVAKYCLFMDRSNCGPSVIPAFFYAMGWVCRRLAMESPARMSPEVKGIIDKVYTERGKELKEAIPVRFEVVSALERFVVECFDKDQVALGIFCWWVLILIFASLRWDDGRHVAPHSLELNDDALLGMVWQTKVDRKRRGTRFAVPKCSLSGASWLEIGWHRFKEFSSDRDFFMWDLKSAEEFDTVPISYSRSLAWLKFCMVKAVELTVEKGHLEQVIANELAVGIQGVSWHSMRVTLLDAAVKNQVDSKIIGLQANWRDPGPMVLKYARQRKDLSVAMVKKLAKDLRETWTPDKDQFEADDDPDVVEPSMSEFVLKDNVSEKALTSSEVKYHIVNRSINPDFSLCGKIPLTEAVSFGSEPPGPVCKLCENALGRAKP